MFRTTALFLTLVFLFAFISVMAGETTTESKATGGKKGQFEGTLVCLGCSLKTADGARAACSTYGHKHALKTADGKYLNFLENQYSADLISGEKYHNEAVNVQGVYFADANLIDVESFEVNGKKKGWCNGCKSMDACAMAKGAK